MRRAYVWRGGEAPLREREQCAARWSFKEVRGTSRVQYNVVGCGIMASYIIAILFYPEIATDICNLISTRA